ncbi:MAG: hypothetical protein ACI9SD_001721 [Pseudohongiellaceae bacterium]|jgi:hypothetical protein
MPDRINKDSFILPFDRNIELIKALHGKLGLKLEMNIFKS